MEDDPPVMDPESGDAGRAPAEAPYYPGTAAVLSALIPGLGHLYRLEARSAAVYFFGAILLAPTIIGVPLVWMAAIRSAMRPAGEPEPAATQVPGWVAALAIGAVMAVVMGSCLRRP